MAAPEALPHPAPFQPLDARDTTTPVAALFAGEQDHRYFQAGEDPAAEHRGQVLAVWDLDRATGLWVRRHDRDADQATLLGLAEVTGAAAYRAGEPAAPSLNPVIREMVRGMPVGTGAADIFRAFSRGYSAAVEHNGDAEVPCTECGHYGNGQVPGCTCKGCDDTRTPDVPAAPGPYGVADWRAPLTDFERRAGVVDPRI